MLRPTYEHAFTPVPISVNCIVDQTSVETLFSIPTGLRPCVVKKWRFGRPVPIVETTFTRPNPVGDVTKCLCRVDTISLSLRHIKQAIWTAVWFVFYDTGA